MTIFLIDQNVNGLMCALYKSFTEKVYPHKVYGAYTFFVAEKDAVSVRVHIDKSHAERVKRAMIKYAGDSVIYQLWVCLMSCENGAVTQAFRYAHRILCERRNVSDDLFDLSVSNFFYTVQKVLNERHHVYQSLTVAEKVGDVLYAPYNPENDLTELVAPIFLEQFSEHPFIIHDVGRNRVALYNGNDIKYAHTIIDPKGKPWQKEATFNQLWKRFFNMDRIPKTDF